MSDLKNQLIRLGNTKPELRGHIKPILRQIASSNWYERDAGSHYASRSFTAMGRLKPLPQGMPSMDEVMRDLRLTPGEADLVLRALEKSPGETRNARAADAHLDRLNKAMKGFGVEALRSDEVGRDRYYGDIVGLYVNMGDTYNATVVYDTRDEVFYYTSYGDFVEAMGY